MEQHNAICGATSFGEREKKSNLVLFLLTGLGFGVGFTVAIALTYGIHVGRRSQNHILCWKEVLFVTRR